MYKNKEKFLLLLIFSLLLYSPYSTNAQDYNERMSGPLDIWFNATVRTPEVELESGDHDIQITLFVENFSDATSLNNTTVEIGIDRGIYFLKSIEMGNFTPSDLSETVFSNFTYKKYWGDVTLSLKVKYIFTRPLYTSHVLSTDWYEFVDFSPKPIEITRGITVPRRTIILIAVGIVSLSGIVIFFSYRFYIKNPPK